MQEQNRRRTGTHYEERAAEWLTERGVQILMRNYRCRFGEIDLIGLDGPYLVFFEVKYRSGSRMGNAAAAVGRRKQETILNTARQFLAARHYRLDAPVRFDVIAVDAGIFSWYRNAFEA